MSRIATVLTGLSLLTSCADAPAPSYRDTDQPLSVTTRQDAARLAGEWHVRAATPGDAALIAVTYRPDGPEAFALTRRVCNDSGACDIRRRLYPATPLGQNRWSLGNTGGADWQIWVVWVDADYRTAAIGTPDGGFGWVLDRAATGGEDRVTAARDILEFNGYQTSAVIPR